VLALGVARLGVVGVRLAVIRTSWLVTLFELTGELPAYAY
jgi:hypothetical protein